VDSNGWVRDDSIVIGCVRLDEEGNEVGYLIQVIRSGGNTFFEVNCSSYSGCISPFDSHFIIWCFFDKCVIFKMFFPRTCLQKADQFGNLFFKHINVHKIKCWQ
jgi:hypothetical protein